jgi:large subunit ribosomal protein L1
MKKRSKRYQENSAQILVKTSPKEAIEILKNFKPAKFNEAVEAHFKLNFGKKKKSDPLRASLVLPHDIGKKIIIAVFIDKDNKSLAEESGADIVFGEKEIDKIGQGEKFNFDIALASPEIMPKLAKIAKVLGPKGLMPNPKSETVTKDIKKAVELLRKGKANIKSDAGGAAHQMIGKISLKTEELLENYQAVAEAIEKQKPAKLKGRFIKKATLALTMSPGVKIKI